MSQLFILTGIGIHAVMFLLSAYGAEVSQEKEMRCLPVQVEHKGAGNLQQKDEKSDKKMAVNFFEKYKKISYSLQPRKRSEDLKTSQKTNYNTKSIKDPPTRSDFKGTIFVGTGNRIV